METATFAGMFGAIIGSFLNVVAYRLPRRESLVRPASHCRACGVAVKPYDNVPFPKHIDFNRPHDEIGLVLDVVKMDINKGVSDDKFVLEQPEGTKLQTVGQAPADTPKGPSQ